MKKLFFSLVAAIVAATATFAQSTLVATLTHGDNVSMYYGIYALSEAHAAAVSGDVINLSGGVFRYIDIRKAVTIRGTGIDDANPTKITGDFIIELSNSETERLLIEGIHCPGKITFRGTFSNPYFVKCKLNTFAFQSTSVKNATFINCKITGNSYQLPANSSAQFINSYVAGFSNNNETTSTASFVNCIVRPYNDHNVTTIRSSQLINCIIFNSTTLASGSLPTSTIATNCVAINCNNIYNNSQINSGSKEATFEEVFKEFSGVYDDYHTFELTESAKSSYLGNDGTEVGWFGGAMPYTSTPSYPQITKMNVANKVTADGKLSVEIEVSAAQ